jgi:DNA-binding LytR/AlgR family response regulator
VNTGGDFMDDEILYIEIKGRKIIVHTTNGVHEGSLSDQLEFILKKYGFERLHGSTLVNMPKIIDYRKRTILMKDGTKLPVSKTNIHKILIYFDK